MMTEIKIPDLTVGETDTHYGLGGWDEVEHYARNNVAMWRYFSDYAEHVGMNEEDRLRFVLWGMTREYARMYKMSMDMAGLYMSQIIVVKPTEEELN